MRPETTPGDFETVRRALTPDKIGFVCMIDPPRIGAAAFIAFLEHRYFTPVPLPRDDFELAEVFWEEMVIFILVIPGSYRAQAETIARELGLRFANGVPHVFSGAGERHFPVDVPNLFTLENIPGHFVYRNNPAERKTARDYELEAIDREVARSMEKLREYERQNQTT